MYNSNASNLALFRHSFSILRHTLHINMVYKNICYNKSPTDIHAELICQSKGLSMSVLWQRCQDDKQDKMARSAAVTGAWQELPESLTPSEGWRARGLIKTSCHLWWPPWQTWQWAWESERSRTSWQSDPGPVAAALATWCRSPRLSACINSNW